MSSVVIVLIASIAALAPLILAWRRPAAAGAVALLYGLLAIVAGAYHAGMVGRPALASTDISSIRTASAAAPIECNEMMQLLERAGVILNRRNPARLVVDQGLWNQLPQEAHTVVVTCIESGRSPNDTRGPVQIVNRGS